MILVILYFISLLVCLYIAYYIFKDNWSEYIGGGNTECISMIVIAFLPILNTTFGILIGGSHLLKIPQLQRYHFFCKYPIIFY